MQATPLPSPEAASAAAALWNQRADDVGPLEFAQALLGLDHDSVRSIAADDLLGWPETSAFLEAAPVLLDRLVVLVDIEEDAPEHHLVCWCLRRIVEAGSDLNRFPAAQFDDEVLRARREAARLASVLLDHPAIGALPRADDHVRAERRVAQGTLRVPYAPALEFCQAERRGLRLEAIVSLLDMRTALQLEVLVAVLRSLWVAGHRSHVTLDELTVRIGSVNYRHPGTRGNDERQGISVGSTLIDVPDWPGQPSTDAWRRLRDRSGVQRALMVESAAAIDAHGEEILRGLRSEDALLATH